MNPEAKEELHAMNSTEIEGIRKAFEGDLYFACKGILGYDQLQPSAHMALCNFLDFEPSKRKLVLMPRGHLKSTICTIGRSIQKAVTAPETYRCLIVNAVAGKAEAFLSEIKAHWEKNEGLRWLYPHLIPVKFSGPGADWSSTTASIRRRAVFKESTWTTVGAGGAGTGWHFNHILPDDLIDERHKQSQADMNRVKIWNRSLEALLDNLDTDEICWIGTRKTVDDVYADVERIWRNELRVFIREPIEDGQPIFPLKFSLSRFANIMENQPEEWAHDYMNNPVGAGGIDWGKDSIRYFFKGDDNRSVVYTDREGVLRKYQLSELDIVLTVDPNSGKKLAPDQAAVVVQAMTPAEDVLVLATRVGRPSPSELVDWAYDMAVEWRPRVVGIEDAGQQNTLFYFQERQKLEVVSFQAIPMMHGNKDKEGRIRKALDDRIKRGRFYIMRSMLTLRSAIEFFPQLSAHMWDELDAISYGQQMLRGGQTEEEKQTQDAAVLRLLTARGITGYGHSFRRR